MKDIGKAVYYLLTKYEQAKNSDYVIKPISWALYQTWQKWDKEEKPRWEIKDENND